MCCRCYLFFRIGKGSNADEQSLASKVCRDILSGGRDISSVPEGSEPEAFWSALGGQAAYANDKHLQSLPAEPRLFQVSGVTGNFTVEELFQWSQDDLAQDATFILDTVAEVAVWIGNNARPADKDAALAIALEYVANAPDGRSKETPVFRIEAGSEPPTFTANFLGWSNERAVDFADPYQKRLEAIKQQQGGAASSFSSSGAVAPAPDAPIVLLAAAARCSPTPSRCAWSPIRS